MNEVFKYQRIKGNLSELYKSETITACCLEENAIIVGTETGYVHVLSLSGKVIKRYHAHEGTVTGLAVDNNGITIFSCSECGSAVINTMGIDGDEKETALTVTQPLKAICAEDSVSSKRERSFIVGGAGGQLIHHRHAWFSQKDIELFRGSGTPVCALAWRGDVVAWADSSQVRVMDVATQAAICYLNSPPNVGPSNPFPCRLFWESEYDLLVGWADSLRHLQLVYTSYSGGEDGQSRSGQADIRARLVADWRCDTIVCGVSSFDQDHVAVLGYTPPDDKDDGGAVGPELMLMHRSDGSVVSADVLPLVGWDELSPESLHMVSNYSCYSRRSDYLKWSLAASSKRGGYRGLPPFTYILSTHDAVVARVRDVNDRITAALQQGDLRKAVDLAQGDRHTLRIYQYHDLVRAYVNSLFNEDKAELAAEECHRLIGGDADGAALWESWIFEFANRKRLSCIAPYVPVETPRLSNSVYKVILENFLLVNPQAFLSAVRKWGTVRPPLFDAASLLDRVARQVETRRKSGTDAADPWLLEAKAHLQTLLHQYDKALECYLEIEPSEAQLRARFEDSDADGADIGDTGLGRDFQYVFDLIEKQDLFHVIQDRVLRLVRLSPKLAESLLVRNVEKIPVYSVVKQLREDTELLHWYLHALSRHAPDLYNTQEYAEFHVMQVSLYAHFAPKPDTKQHHQAKVGEQLEGRPLVLRPDQQQTSRAQDSDFLQFLKFSNFVPLEVALRECERQQPPLYREMIYILAQMGMVKEGLALLLRETGDVNLAVEYVEQNDPELWEDVVNHALSHHDFLAELMDLIGMYHKFNPLTLVKKLPPCMEIPLLRQRLLRLIKHCDFQEFMRGQCRLILQDDTVTLLRQLNRSQRRGMKVNAGSTRCAGCGRPTSMPPPLQVQVAQQEAVLPGSSAASGKNRNSVPVWGLPPSRTQKSCAVSPSSNAPSSVVYLSNKIAYHMLCFDRVYESGA